MILQAGAGIVYDSGAGEGVPGDGSKARGPCTGNRIQGGLAVYVIIDNYDSFTHNLYQYLCELTEEKVEVFESNRITVDEVIAMNPAGVVISPGPGGPEGAGISVECIQRLAGTVPILGVCLGHQAIGQAFGAKIVTARRIVHGKTEEMSLNRPGPVPRPAALGEVHPLPFPRHPA